MRVAGQMLQVQCACFSITYIMPANATSRHIYSPFRLQTILIFPHKVQYYCVNTKHIFAVVCPWVILYKFQSSCNQMYYTLRGSLFRDYFRSLPFNLMDISLKEWMHLCHESIPFTTKICFQFCCDFFDCGYIIGSILKSVRDAYSLFVSVDKLALRQSHAWPSASDWTDGCA